MLLALCIRVPVTRLCKQSTITKLAVMLGLLLLINTIIGTIWFFQLIDTDKNAVGENGKKFELNDDYLAHGVIMILIPWSIFLFLIILLVKIICFFFAERKQRGAPNFGRRQGRMGSYGQFNEDDEVLDPETEAVIGVYFRIMDKVLFRTVTLEEANSGHELAYMAD